MQCSACSMSVLRLAHERIIQEEGINNYRLYGKVSDRLDLKNPLYHNKYSNCFTVKVSPWQVDSGFQR